MARKYNDANVAPGRGVQGGYANPMSAGQKRSPDQIEDDIEATRARIEARLEGLSAQTAPARLLETTLGADLSSPSNTINSLYLRARSNPISAGLIGAGLLALYLGRKTEDPVAIARARREAERDEGREVPGPATRDAAERVAYDIAALKGHARNVSDDVSSAAASAKASLTSSASSTRDSGSALASDAAQTYGGAKAAVASTASSVTSSVVDAYEGAADTLSRAPTYARERAEYAGSWVQENPVAAGMIGLAAGAVAASIFATSKSKAPRSRAEATRRLYRQADGYSTSEALQAQALRSAPAASTAGVRRATSGAGTKSSAVKGAANPARSTASQAARRAPATAKETVGKTTKTSTKSTVGKTSTAKKSAAPKPVAAQTGAAKRPASKPGAKATTRKPKV